MVWEVCFPLDDLAFESVDFVLLFDDGDFVFVDSFVEFVDVEVPVVCCL